MASQVPPAEMANAREEIWKAIVQDRVTSDTALAIRNLMPAVLTIDRSTVLGSTFDHEVESAFVAAVIRIKSENIPAEKVVLALLVEEDRIDEAAERYEAAIRTAGDNGVAKLRNKAGLFALARPSIAIDAYARVLEIAKDDVEAGLRLGCLLKLTGDHVHAAERFLGLLELPGLSDRDRARALSELARIAERLDHPDAAVEFAQQALALHTELCDGSHMAEEARALADLAAARGDLAAARHYEELHLAVGRDEARAGGDVAVELTSMSLRHQDIAEALVWCRDAVDGYEKANCEPKLAAQLCQLGSIYWRSEMPDAAAQAYERAHQICAHIGDEQGNALALHNLGLLHLLRADYEAAEQRLLAALEIYTGRNDQQNCAEVLARLGDVAASRGLIDQARESWMKALARYNNIGHRDTEDAQYLRDRLDETR